MSNAQAAVVCTWAALLLGAAAWAVEHPAWWLRPAIVAGAVGFAVWGGVFAARGRRNQIKGG